MSCFISYFLNTAILQPVNMPLIVSYWQFQKQYWIILVRVQYHQNKPTRTRGSDYDCVIYKIIRLKFHNKISLKCILKVALLIIVDSLIALQFN